MSKHEGETKKPVYKKVWFWIIVVVAIIVIGSQLGDKANTITTGTNASGTETKEEEMITVDYSVLYQDYMDNPIAADTKYKGKTLKLTGTVGTIDREIAGNTYITFDIEFLKNIRITFKKSEESKVAELKKGQEVTIKGVCQGTLLSTTVALDDCEIIIK